MAANPLFTQRDLNCLGDPEKNTRKRALEKILKDSENLSKKPAEFTPEVAQECLSGLHKALLKCAKDQAEKCRELSVTILTVLMPMVKDASAFGGDTIVTVRDRIGSNPVAEESEEVRLQLLKLLEVIISGVGASIQKNIDDVAAILEKGVLDKFPDAKKLSSQLLVKMSDISGEELKEYCPQLCKALVVNLGHQQQKIRLAALQAIGALIPHASLQVLDDTLPHIGKLNLDRTVQLREAVLKVAGTWLAKLPENTIPKIVPIVLHGAADEMDEVQQTSVDTMEEAGRTRSESAGNAAPEADEAQIRAAQPFYPAAFKGRPNPGARSLVANTLEPILRLLVNELSDWTATTRAKAASTLLNVIVYAENKVTSHAELLLGAFAKACMDEEEVVAARTTTCVRLAGAFVPAELFVSIIDGNVRSGTQSAAGKKSWVAVLATLLEGSTEEQVAPLMGSICEMIVEMELQLPEQEEFQVQILRVILACIATGKGSCKEHSLSLFKFLLRIQGMQRVVPDLADKATEGIEQLAVATGYGSSAGLYGELAGPVLSEIAPGAPQWRRDSHALLLFDTVLRHAKEALTPNIKLCVPVFALAADHNRDADLRSTLLVLLDHFLTNEAINSGLKESGGELLNTVVVPVCVWRAGKVAGALRKGGVACLKSLLASRLCTADDLMKELGKGFADGPLAPILKSALDDDDPEIRFITCGLMQEMFKMVEGRLDDEQVRNQYIELLKRLDDSNDRIRIEAAKAFENFLPSMPRGYDSAQYDYVIRTLVVHLDDQNSEVQEGVLPAVYAAAAVNPKQFIEIVKECAAKHRTTTYCDKAIERATQLQRNAAL